MIASPVQGFSVSTAAVTAPRATALLNAEGNDEAQPDSLILGGEEREQQLNQLKSKYPTSEADYLAAARARAAAKTPSASQKASDEDWQKIAEEKKKAGVGADDDGWESSLEDAESAILIMSTNEDGEPEDDGEPTLLL